MYIELDFEKYLPSIYQIDKLMDLVISIDENRKEFGQKPFLPTKNPLVI